MIGDDLDDVLANVAVLIREELDVRHRLGGHAILVPECPRCSHRIG